MEWKNAVKYDEFDFNSLSFNYCRSRNRGKNTYYTQENIITLDTETTIFNDEIGFVTDWSITIENNTCIYGFKIQALIFTLKEILKRVINNDLTKCVIYVHNFSYDYMFLRNHLIEAFGKPKKYLAVKTHKIVFMEFENGLIFRDSYILTQKSLAKFTEDMHVTQKAVGEWDYSKKRLPDGNRTENELKYMLLDTISLNEALRKFFDQHHVNNATTQLTSTGFIRRRGLQCMYDFMDNWNKTGFRDQALTLEEYKILLDCYHGGYTHANRYDLHMIFDHVESYDFASSYPAVMCYEKFPMSKFTECTGIGIETILKTQDKLAYFGYLSLVKPVCKKLFPMPVIQSHKTKYEENAVYDNGKLISADYVVVPFTDPDLYSILLSYDYEQLNVGKCYYAVKGYLPEFITHKLIMPLFEDKCTLKGVDDINYMISKGFINGIYGMCVQRILNDDITEDFDTGEWHVEKTVENVEKAEKQLTKFYRNHNKYLEYQWGCWVTAYAQRNLFKLGMCADEWIYSDTDSVKATGFNEQLIKEYNNNIIKTAEKRGIGIVKYNGKTFVLGVAEKEKDCTEFVTVGSKRYCYRQDGELKITVAGVPKKSAHELKDDITNFKPGFIFCSKTDKDAEEKTTAVYCYNQGIKTVNIKGMEIEYGSFIRLDRVEYKLDSAVLYDRETGLPYLGEYQSILEE